ncbi:MAG: type II toxin-antitoxin system HicB family antitoxin [bacterium]
MLRNYTAKYTRIDSGYMGQLIEWPEVITEGKTVEDCRVLLKDALNEMVLAYQQLHKELTMGSDFFEPVTVDIADVSQTS